jgi:hypothetical protein
VAFGESGVEYNSPWFRCRKKERKAQSSCITWYKNCIVESTFLTIAAVVLNCPCTLVKMEEEVTSVGQDA